MEETRCENCRHWTPNPPPFNQWQVEGWGICERTRSSNSEPLAANTLAVAQDMEDCEAWLKTAAAFGCVQWESRTQEGVPQFAPSSGE